jgi:glycine cleavage system aminomethyltransferase T
VQVWDRLTEVGRDHDLETCGYRALDGLRIEKGYRYFGSDLTASDTPLEAGLEAFVALDAHDFVGLDVLLSQRERGVERRLRTILVGAGADYLTIYGGESVLAGGGVVGSMTSCAYGYTIARNVGLAYLPIRFDVGDALEVEVFGRRIPAEVAPDVLYDPDRKRMAA